MACAGKGLSRAEAAAFRAGLKFRRITDADEGAARRFSCGQQEVDEFLRDRALDAMRNNWCVTWLFEHDGDVVGFVSLASVSIEMTPHELSAHKLPERPRTWPGLLIGMLGVDSRYKGRRTGPHLLRFALGQAVLLTKDVGCRFLVADVNSADPAAIKMYREFGFEAAGHEKYESSAKRGQPRYFYDVHTDPPADLAG